MVLGGNSALEGSRDENQAKGSPSRSRGRTSRVEASTVCLCGYIDY